MTYQTLAYCPNGEELINIRNGNDYYELHRFSAYHFDQESGTLYAGARNLDPLRGNFNSVDRFAEKFPWQSPYAYCNNNPLIYVDTDGKFAVPIHRNITQQAMARSGISAKTSAFFHTDLVLGASYIADYAGFAFDWHFDGRANYSAVQARWNSLNQDIATTVGNIGGGNKLLGGNDVVKLGNLIHNVQDFYAHSNYVELYIEYYQGANNGAMPTSVPIYDEGIKNTDFNNLLKDNLRTGDFHILDNEKTNPNGARAQSPTSHNKMNKDNANTYAGKLAKETAIKHTTKILKEVE
jgi:RHS repeat-associated protein